MKITETKLRKVIRQVIREVAPKSSSSNRRNMISNGPEIDMVDERIKDEVKNTYYSCFKQNMDSDHEGFLFNYGDEMESFIVSCAEMLSDGMGGYGGPGGIYPTTSGLPKDEYGNQITDEMLSNVILPAYEVFQDSKRTNTMPLAKAVTSLAMKMLY